MEDSTQEGRLAAVVAAGAHFLDDWLSPTWAQDVDTDILNLQNPTVCVIGQLYQAGRIEDGFWTVRAKNGGAAWAISHGFDLPSCCEEPICSCPWDELEKAWESEISARLEASHS